MQAAIEPLLRQHSEAKPFAGAIVGGQWTATSLAQMASVGFTVLHLPYAEIVDAFSRVGINIATEEHTKLAQLQAMVDRYDALDAAGLTALGNALRACAPAEFARFRAVLAAMVVRNVERVTVLQLHGHADDFATADDAIEAIEQYSPRADEPHVRWEITVRFANGDRIEAQFAEEQRAVDFLHTFA
jgi:hypothetical protein